ncbi:MAG: amidohydrolase family protein [Planctomycetes bacterium]|nr:amidohydrolase family protein [Planctomycetota bacterium]
MIDILFAFATAVLPAEGTLAIRARAVWTGAAVLENAVVVVADGRIRSVGAEAPRGVEVLEHPGVLTAGLIALHGPAGAVGETSDGTRPALPEARVGLAVDPRSVELVALHAAGITSILVTPDPAGITAGTSALVRTADGSILRDPAHLSLVFSAEGLAGNRAPTSRSGALAMLDELFAGTRGHVADAKAGRLPCLFEVRERDDVQRAVAFARQRKLAGALHGAALSGELASAIRGSGLAVISPVLGVGTPRRVLDAVAQLAKEEVPFGFGLDAPWNHQDSLRLSAVLCLRAGLDRAAAWRALTANAARIAGAGDRVGRIERGLDADLVLWSGDPLDLASRAEVVFTRGVARTIQHAVPAPEEVRR